MESSRNRTEGDVKGEGEAEMERVVSLGARRVKVKVEKLRTHDTGHCFAPQV